MAKFQNDLDNLSFPPAVVDLVVVSETTVPQVIIVGVNRRGFSR